MCPLLNSPGMPMRVPVNWPVGSFFEVEGLPLDSEHEQPEMCTTIHNILLLLFLESERKHRPPHGPLLIWASLFNLLRDGGLALILIGLDGTFTPPTVLAVLTRRAFL